MNPFEADEAEIIEGFLCPMCRQDLKNADRLMVHVEREHSEDQDVLQSFKEIFSKPSLSSFALKSKNRLLSRGDLDGPSSGNAISPNNHADSSRYPQQFNYVQDVGVDREHSAHFKSIRTPRVERYATETNKLIIRLHKLLTDRPEDSLKRKQHEQQLVAWVDGNLVKLCPNCARKFNITRRQHHCRLCGSVMCFDCSRYLNVAVAASLADPSPANAAASAFALATDAEDPENLRVCEHCLHLLENRKEAQDSRNSRPQIVTVYERIQELKRDIRPDTVSYAKIVNKLFAGDSVFTLQDASVLRARIGKAAESIDTLSKSLLEIATRQGSREETLKKCIRLACIAYIKDEMLSLPPLPQEADLKRIQAERRVQTEMRIERERRLAAEAFERAAMASGSGLPTDNTTVRELQGATGGVRFYILKNNVFQILILGSSLNSSRRSTQWTAGVASSQTHGQWRPTIRWWSRSTSSSPTSNRRGRHSESKRWRS